MMCAAGEPGCAGAAGAEVSEGGGGEHERRLPLQDTRLRRLDRHR
jgi:hypothetical protein